MIGRKEKVNAQEERALKINLISLQWELIVKKVISFAVMLITIKTINVLKMKEIVQFSFLK